MPNKTELKFISIKDIWVAPDRARKDFGDLVELMHSIESQGLLQPLVVGKNPKQEDNLKPYILLDGERRFRACVLAKKTEIPVIIKLDLDDVDRKRIEYITNIFRKDFDWPEKIEIVRQIDEMEKAKALARGEKWTTTEDTARHLKSTKTSIARQIAFAKKLKNRPDLIEKVRQYPMSVAIEKVKKIEEKEKLQRLEKEGILKINSNFKLGNSLDLIKEIPDASIDLILMDPPFGERTLSAKSSTEAYPLALQETDNLDPEKAVKLFKDLTPQLARVLKPGNHLYTFFAFPFYTEFKEILEQNNFIVSRFPLIWYKELTTCANGGYNFARSYEPILFAIKKAKNCKKLTGSCRDVLSYKPTQQKNKVHPFQKPLSLLKFLIHRSTSKGDTVLDPFAGGASTLVACEETGRTGIGFEIDEQNYYLARKRLEKGSKDDNTDGTTGR